MKRLLWLGIGLAVGALVVRAAARKAQAFTPQGIAGSVQETAGGLLDSVRNFVADVRDGMVEREAQIHEAFSEGVAIDAVSGGRADLDFDDVDYGGFEYELRAHRDGR
jgi:hypothetical protein